MLRISKLGDYATIIMVFLTRHTQETFSAKMIAEQTYVSLPTTSKLLKLLVTHNLLTSQRGSQGGYELARPAEKISIMQIIHAIDGDEGLTECSYHDDRCALQAVCLARGSWRVVNRAIEMVLDSVSLAEFAKPEIAFNPFKNILERKVYEHE